jgi:hypothetical protein
VSVLVDRSADVFRGLICYLSYAYYRFSFFSIFTVGMHVSSSSVFLSGLH